MRARGGPVRVVPDLDHVAGCRFGDVPGGSDVRRRHRRASGSPPLPNGDEPEYPAPVLALTSGPPAPKERHATPAAPAPTTAPAVSAAPTSGEHAETQAGPDNTARALAGGALLVAAIGVGVAVARRRT